MCVDVRALSILVPLAVQLLEVEISSLVNGDGVDSGWRFCEAHSQVTNTNEWPLDVDVEARQEHDQQQGENRHQRHLQNE